MATFSSARKFLTHLKENQATSRALLVTAKDQARLEAIIEEIKKALFSSEHRKSLEVLRIDGNELSQKAAIRFQDQLRSLDLFSRAQLFWIQKADKIPTTSLDTVLDAIQHLPEDSSALFTCEKILATHKLRKRLQKSSLYFELKPFSSVELRKWTTAQLRAAGVSQIAQSVPETLIELSEGTPDKIVSYAKHLAAYTSDGSVTEDDIFALFVGHPNPNEFTLLDVIGRGDTVQMELLLNQLVTAGKNPFLLLSMLARSVANYLTVSSLQKKGKTEAQIQAQTGMKPWVLKKTCQALKKYPRWKQEELSKALVKADSKLKDRSLGAEYVLSDLMYAMSPVP